MKFFLPLASLFLFVACGAPPATVADDKPTAPASAPYNNNGLDKYWYQGKAEISTYELEQIRYGEIHPGTVTLIQVSEDFLTDEQVKNDKYENPNSASIIKTNLLRRFTTGIYDYSAMTSVFTPTGSEFPMTQKVTCSVQDWCGQSFTQLNYTGGNGYDMQLRSYFETEGDVNTPLDADFLEDEVFNRIRMFGGDIPTGTFRVVPPTSYLLMMHKPYKAARAEVIVGEREGLQVYTMTYPELDRKLEVVFEPSSPFKIVGWTETYPSRGKTLTTVATLTHQVLDDYWGHNSVADGSKREQLGL